MADQPPATDDWDDPVGPHVKRANLQRENPDMSPYEAKKQEVISAILAFTSDTSVPMQETLAALEDIRNEVDSSMEAIRDDMRLEKAQETEIPD